jgi:hypothetical protein
MSWLVPVMCDSCGTVGQGSRPHMGWPLSRLLHASPQLHSCSTACDADLDVKSPDSEQIPRKDT